MVCGKDVEAERLWNAVSQKLSNTKLTIFMALIQYLFPTNYVKMNYSSPKKYHNI